MANRKLLEDYPLYRKFRMELPELLHELPKPAINMFCEVEKSNQTFNMAHEYYNGHIGSVQGCLGTTREVKYICQSCKKFNRYFLLEFGEDNEGEYVMKVGQAPPWDITPDNELQKTLGEKDQYYRKALVCESQSYGIGAFAYYRRIVEEIIDDLLLEISDLIENSEQKDKYQNALEQAKESKVAQEKIRLVKDLLPASLRPGGMNPLSVLHEVLSEGIHNQTDEKCIEYAEDIRSILEFLVNQISLSKTAKESFTDSMRKLLDRKSRDKAS